MVSQPILCDECGVQVNPDQQFSCHRSTSSQCTKVFLCINCRVVCGMCNTVFCHDCLKSELLSLNPWTCVTHRHCIACLRLPDPCSVNGHGCQCGCGDFQPEQLIWKTKKDRRDYVRRLKMKETQTALRMQSAIDHEAKKKQEKMKIKMNRFNSQSLALSFTSPNCNLCR
jgi:hypothetical protein